MKSTILLLAFAVGFPLALRADPPASNAAKPGAALPSDDVPALLIEKEKVESELIELRRAAIAKLKDKTPEEQAKIWQELYDAQKSRRERLRTIEPKVREELKQRQDENIKKKNPKG